jgi:glycosyltransferase involved in cell wall biosynthesis
MKQTSSAKSNTSSATSTKRLLFFSIEDWNEVWRRNQFFCAELVRRNPDAEILWVNPVVDLLHSLMRHDFSQFSAIRLAPNAVTGQAQILTIKPIKILPNKLGREFNNRLFADNIRSALHSLGWTSYDVWINAQSARQLLPFPGTKKLIYDITDDWTKMPQPEHIRLATIEDDAAMLRDADHVIVCSRQLYESKKNRCRELTLIHNGVDDHRYHPDQLSKTETPADIGQIQKPIIGYTGTLHSSRLDLALTAQVADELKHVNFVFVGPDCLTAAERKLLNKPNIHILGSRSYEELPRYIARFDAYMTPHLVNDFTESLDPLKLYEYMSTGKPIISTDCAGFREMTELVSIAPNASEFARAIEVALNSEDPARACQRIAWAQNQSWTARVIKLEEILGWNE